jgi:hypothetical protein
MGRPDQGGEAAVATSEIEKPMDVLRQPFEQRAFTFGAVRDSIGTRQVLERVISGRPEVGRDRSPERRTSNVEHRTWNVEPRTQNRT